jgi:hypothetical protein
MALTTNQQSYVDQITDSFQSFKTALIQALNSDNNRDTHLDTAAERFVALRRTHVQLAVNLSNFTSVTVGNDGVPPGPTEEQTLQRFDGSRVDASTYVPRI